MTVKVRMTELKTIVMPLKNGTQKDLGLGPDFRRDDGKSCDDGNGRDDGTKSNNKLGPDFRRDDGKSCDDGTKSNNKKKIS